MTASGQALKQRRAFSQRPSLLVRSRPSVAIEPSLIALEGGPVNEAGMMVGDENGPLIEGKMTHSFLDGSVCIDVAFTAGLAVGIRASIHRIGQDVVNGGVSGSDPANLSLRPILQREGQSFGAEPKPDPARRAELGEALEDRVNRSGHGGIGMEENFAVGFTPDKTNGQAAAQLTASRLVADATFQPGADDVQLCFAHGALEAEEQTIIEQRRMINTIVVTDERIGEAAELQQTIPVGVVPGQP